MTHINLLPWRVELRKKQREDFLARMLLWMMLAAGLMVVVHLRLGHTIDWQARRNSFLQSEIRILDEKIKEIDSLDAKKRGLLARMEIIQQLQVSRPEMVHLFDEIAQRVPEGVALLDIAQNDRRLVINGIAQSNAVVSNFLNNLAGSPWLAKPVLKVIQVRAERDPRLGTVLAFTVQVDQSARRPVDADPAT